MWCVSGSTATECAFGPRRPESGRGRTGVSEDAERSFRCRTPARARRTGAIAAASNIRRPDGTQAQDALDLVVNEVGIGSGIDQGGTGSGPVTALPPPVWSTPQVHAYAEVVVAVFPTGEAAEAVLDRLRAAGVGAEQCGCVARTGPLTHASGLLARAGCADGGPVEALSPVGVPSETARLYQRAFEAGQAVITVRPTGGTDQAVSALQQVVDAEAPPGLNRPSPAGEAAS
jgi:hypothetical protein